MIAEIKKRRLRYPRGSNLPLYAVLCAVAVFVGVWLTFAIVMVVV